MATAVLAGLMAGCAERGDTPAAPVPHAPVRSVGTPGSIQYFGYIGGVGDAALDGAAPFANFGWISTDSSSSSTYVSGRVNALASHNMKSVVELGLLLWCGPGYGTLCPGWQSRWSTWKSANATALASGSVIAFVVRDEPFHSTVNIAQYDSASVVVKRDFPNAKLLLVEAAVDVADASPVSWFNLYASQVTTVDWIGVDKYAIHPQYDATYGQALYKLQTTYPGRKTAYSLDGSWNPDYVSKLGTSDTTVMASVAKEWYDMARQDASAVMVGVFIWDSLPGWTTSRDMPRSVVAVHDSIGKATRATAVRRLTFRQVPSSRSAPTAGRTGGPAIPTVRGTMR